MFLTFAPTSKYRCAGARVALRAALITALAITLQSCDRLKNGNPSAFHIISPCPFSAAADIDPSRLTCGYLNAPENRNDPDATKIKIPVAIIKSQNGAPKPDPVVFLHGGPGAAPLESDRVFKLFAGHKFGEDRDIIIYNQRGSRMVEPALDCGELLTNRIDAFKQDLTLSERDHLITALAVSCLQVVKDSGRDLRGYTAVENAADLRDLRQSLGVKQWNLMAVSYGVLMALEAVRVDEDGVRSMILDSAVSNESDLFMSEANRNFTQGINRVLSACAEAPLCAETFPHLDEKLASILDALRETPVTLTLDGVNNATHDVSVNWHDFLNLIHWMLYNSETLRLVPLLISQTESGDTSLLRHQMNTVFPAPKNVGLGASPSFFAIVCNDQYRNREVFQAHEQHYGGFASTSFMEAICAESELDFADPAPLSPTQVDTPTLLLTGYFDPMTPDIYADQIKKNLPRSELVQVSNFGHSTLSGYTACQTVLAKTFLDALARTEAFSCADELPGPDFILSQADLTPP